MTYPVLMTALAGMAAAALVSASATAQIVGPADIESYTTRNGVGPDPDRDGNPATNTRAMYRIGSAAEASLDPPYRVITFEAPPSGHGDPIRNQYAPDFGVTFGPGLTRQICEGQRYFRYDSQCTYRRAPSGRFAALYRDDWGRPLEINFARPVCVATLAIYPTGGREGESYRVRVQPYGENGQRLQRASVRFNWTKDTFRWRLMAGAYMLDQKASRIEVDVESVDDRRKTVRFLIDDLAFVEEGCGESLQNIADAAAAAGPRQPRDRRRRDSEGGEEVDLTGAE